MKKLPIIVVALFVLVAGRPVFAQTQANVVAGGANKQYEFTPRQRGQLAATLSWENAATTLALLLICGDTDPLSFGVAAGGLDRTARLESGLLGNRCLISVASLDGPSTAFKLHLDLGAGLVSMPKTGESRAIVSRLAEEADRFADALRRARD